MRAGGRSRGYTASVIKGRMSLLGVACAGLLLGSACNGPGNDSRTEDLSTLIIGRASDAISLDPARITDNESVEICGQVYESLLRYRSGTTEVEAGLAKSWSISDDGREWNFELRPGVKFHDGTDLDAQAVVFSFLRQLDPAHEFHREDSSGLGFAWRSAYQNILRVEATGKLSVRIVIDRQFAPFAANLAMFPVAIVSPTAVKKWGEHFYRHPVGTGPFQFEEWTEGRIVLERFRGYWGVEPSMRRLVFKEIPDAQQRLVSLESEAVHVAYSILPNEQQFVALHPRLKLYTQSGNNVSYLAMNTQKPPFDDIRIRRALNFAIDKERIVKLAFQGLAEEATGALPPRQWGYSPNSFPYQLDKARARGLLQEAIVDGVLDPELEVEFYVPITPRPYFPDPRMVAQMVKANLEEVGLKVKLVEQDFASHLTAMRRGKHDISLMGWVGDNGDPDNYLYVLFDEENAQLGTARNVSFLRDSQLHQLLLAAQKNADKDQRTIIYEQAQARIGLLAPWVPLAHSQISFVALSEVTGIAIGANGQIRYEKVERK